MKPNEKKPETVFRIIDRKTGEAVGSYSRAYCDEYDFRSVNEARGANCHGTFRDKGKYAIAQYRVVYELIEPDVDGASDSGRALMDFKRLLTKTKPTPGSVAVTGELLDEVKALEPGRVLRLQGRDGQEIVIMDGDDFQLLCEKAGMATRRSE